MRCSGRHRAKTGGIINKRTKSFFESEEGITLRDELIKMVKSDDYNAKTKYSTLSESGLSFVDKHMNYMSLYPNLNCSQYVSNLKLMTKRK